MSGDLRHVFEIEIKTTPEALWQAITDPDFTHRYYHESRVLSDWTVGSPYQYVLDDGTVAIKGVVLEADPPWKLVMTFSMQYRPELAADKPSREIWEIEQRGEVCKLTVVHDEFEGETETFKVTGRGKPALLESLKSLLETGVPLPL